jgi:hypothetical protein
MRYRLEATRDSSKICVVIIRYLAASHCISLFILFTGYRMYPSFSRDDNRSVPIGDQKVAILAAAGGINNRIGIYF